MKYTILVPIIVGLLPPIIAGIVGYVLSRSGIPGKIKEIEYYLKKLELMNQLSSYLEKNDIEGDRESYVESIDREISEILAFIRKSKAEETKVRILTEERRSNRLSKIFILPKPITVWGWASTIVYYLYGFSTLMYVILSVVSYVSPSTFESPSNNNDLELKTVYLAGIFGGLILSLFGRYCAIKSWRKRRKQLDETTTSKQEQS